MKPEKERQRFAIDSKDHNVISFINEICNQISRKNEISNEVYHVSSIIVESAMYLY